jgi:agmatinase
LANTDLQKKRADKIASFDPDTNGLTAHGIFGLPFMPEESQVVLLPVPWETTVSYGTGTAEGPQAILHASRQIDLYDPLFPGGWKVGIAMQNLSPALVEQSGTWRAQADLYLREFGSSATLSPQANQILEGANQACDELRAWVKSETSKLMDQGKIVGVVGGDHSVPLGYMQALAERHESFAILQIDAHADLRIAYEGFTYSHASIMYNALQIPNMERLVQVGIRDFSQGEYAIVKQSAGRVNMYTDYGLKKSLYEGVHWHALVGNIIQHLPDKVYISFDIDGLQPWLCPNTGTPVPGGLLLEEVFYLLEKVVESNRKIIGFDLCEVSPGEEEWDGNVGARVLYKLCLLAARSNGLAI